MTTSKSPSHTGHRRRLHARIDNSGFDSFLDHEILELLLTCVIARKDTKPIAWDLLNRFGSITHVLDADETSLLDTPGVGPKTAHFLKLIHETIKRYMRARIPKQIKLTSPQNILDYCHTSLSGKKEELLEVIFLSARCTVLRSRIMAIGSITKITVEPRQIIEEALKEKASGIIIVHNHPSGNPTPSTEDITWTKQLEKAAKLFNIILWEHFIMAQGSHFSFRGNNLLDPPPQLQKR
ncbi:RadC family protein [Candidatus Avelusimicrobium luingense]|uniref:RadC family protein n=1 Tax=Candidatus Avelusimicrobium luingense TaxID=3416211 RepID=UPI003D0D2606